MNYKEITKEQSQKLKELWATDKVKGNEYFKTLYNLKSKNILKYP